MADTSLPYEPYGAYQYGRDAERVIADYLDSKGWKILISEGSRGPADLIAKNGSRKWIIQVKSTITRSPQVALVSFFGSKTVNDLKKYAAKLGGTPVLAQLSPKLNTSEIPPAFANRIINIESSKSIFTNQGNGDNNPHGQQSYTLIFYSVRTSEMLIP